MNLKNKFIYYVGPVNAVRDEVIGPAGPTTATRMDQFMEMMLGELDVLGTIGKAEKRFWGRRQASCFVCRTSSEV